VRGSGGYRLDLEAESLDLLRFRTIREDARELAEGGEPARATERLIEALGLWRGPTASGIAPHIRAHPVFAAVDREHLFVVKEAAETALQAGPGLTERVLVTLRQAAAHHPLDEVLQARLMVVLAATGHQAEALEVYRAVRDRLSDDLGLDPGPELRAAQEQVLRQTVPLGPPGREGGRGAPATSPQAVPEGTDEGGSTNGQEAESAAGDDSAEALVSFTPKVLPAQLPADLSAFTGRRSELAKSHALLPGPGKEASAVVIGAFLVGMLLNRSSRPRTPPAQG